MTKLNKKSKQLFACSEKHLFVYDIFSKYHFFSLASTNLPVPSLSSFSLLMFKMYFYCVTKYHFEKQLTLFVRVIYIYISPTWLVTINVSCSLASQRDRDICFSYIMHTLFRRRRNPIICLLFSKWSVFSYSRIPTFLQHTKKNVIIK